MANKNKGKMLLSVSLVAALTLAGTFSFDSYVTVNNVSIAGIDGANFDKAVVSYTDEVDVRDNAASGAKTKTGVITRGGDEIVTPVTGKDLIEQLKNKANDTNDKADDTVKTEEKVKSEDKNKTEEKVKSEDKTKTEEKAKSEDKIKTEDKAKTEEKVKTEDKTKTEDEVKSEDKAKTEDKTKTDDKAKSEDKTKADESIASLYGVSTASIAEYTEFASEEAIEYLADEWGLNAIRFELYTSGVNGYCIADEDGKEALEDVMIEAVNSAIDNDMYAIIDWHNLTDYNPNKYIADSILFFDEMSKEFADSDHVIYEICNEPGRHTTWEQVYEYAAEVIPVIRDNDKDAIIIVGTPKSSRDLGAAFSNQIDEEGIFYAVHANGSEDGEELRSQITMLLSEGMPIIVSQFDLTDGSEDIDEDEIVAWYEFAKESGVSFIVGGFSNEDSTAAFVKESSDAVSDFSKKDLTDAGKWILASVELSSKDKADKANDKNADKKSDKKSDKRKSDDADETVKTDSEEH